MSSILIDPLIHDYEVKYVKVHSFKVKHEHDEENKTFDVEISDGTAIKLLVNTVLFFQTMSKRMTLLVHQSFHTLTGVWLRTLLSSSSQPLCIKIIRPLWTLTTLKKNGLIHYFQTMHLPLRKNGWEMSCASPTQWRWKILAIAWSLSITVLPWCLIMNKILFSPLLLSRPFC